MKLPGALLTMAMVALLVSACTLGSDSGGGSDASGGRERTEDEQPLGTDPEAVTPYASELLLAYDRLMTEINADPSIANDPDDPLIEELVALFELDEGVEQDWRDGWVEQADQGLRTVPVSDDYPALKTTIDGELEGVSEDEVRFPICQITRSQEIQTDGNDEADESVLGVPRIDQPGVASAVRVDGEWLLRAFDISEQEFGCAEQSEEQGGEESGD